MSNRKRLERQMTARSLEAHDGLMASRAAFYASNGEWSDAARTWRRFLEQWNEGPSQIPANPLAGSLQDVDIALAPLASGVSRGTKRLYPMPASISPGTDPGVDPNADQPTPLMQRTR